MASVVVNVSLLATENILSIKHHLHQTSSPSNILSIKHRQFARACPASADQAFGPAIRGCRSHFDFTLLFQETILTLLPCIVFILLASLRAIAVLREAPVTKTDWAVTAKTANLVVSSGLSIAFLIMQIISDETKTTASIAAAALSLFASLAAAGLSPYEHTRSIYPSNVLLAYLFFTVLFGVVRARTYWLMPQSALAAILTADCAVKTLAFCLEAKNKSHLSLSSERTSSEESAGPFSKAFFFWLNSLFFIGFKRSFQPADVGPIDKELYADSLRKRFAPIFNGTIDSPFKLALLTLKCLGLSTFKPMLPRLALAGFTYSQTFFVEAMLNYLNDDDAPMNNGIGLIGACFLVYLGVAVSTSLYWRQVFRNATMIRGGLVTGIFEKVLRLREDSNIESTAMTLMISDVQRIIKGAEFIYEVFVGIIETSLATYLLYRQIGVACFTMLGLGLVCGGGSVWIARILSVQQQAWLSAVETRIGATKRLLDSMKSVKMMGSEERIGAVVKEFRDLEIHSAKYFRTLACIMEPRNTVKAIAGCGTATATPDTDATLAVSLQDASFGWTTEKSILRNVSLKIEQGSQIAIVGRVGSGKSLLMKSIVGEAELLGGSVAVTNRSVAYCGQTAWLENVSAEMNWTQYVASSDISWLEKVKHACALEDLEKLSDYRHGTVGSGGVRLSGGQRQRLALARGVSAKKQIMILDDVFSALDRRTKKRVATKLLGSQGLLRQLKTTVIYTTHDKNLAALADEVYEIQKDGSLNKVSAAEIEEEPSDEEDAGKEASKDRNASTGIDPASDETETTKTDSTTETKSNKVESSKLIGDRLVYLRYIRAMGYLNAIIFLLIGIIFAVAFMFPNLWVQWWSNALANGDTRGNGYWLGYFALIEILPLITIFAWTMHLMLGVVPASARSLHAALLKTTLGAPFSYISRIDTGSLLNRFNQDLLFVDGFLPLDLFNTVAELLTAMFQLILIAVVANEALAVIPVAALVLYMIQKVYLRTSKQLRNLDLESKDMLHTKLGETASGLITIRANGFVGEMRQKFIEKFDRSQEPFYLLFMAQRWLQLVLELVVAGLAVAIACVAVGLRGKVAAGAVGVAFLNVTTIGSTLTNFIIAWTSLETSLGAIARIAVFERDTPKEIADGQEKTVVSDAWPSKGHVQIENIHATYASED
ncbi:Multidrug resistance-associated protein 1 [Beauveria bassiana]|uniref:Multidrug resistance-associated protein 1 n=1 Tax=Beauveria bassiana TaxID=176275 RepID=A0A2N6NVK6_BEABA|nr:Multidrug resistance-associated protein 1 [Beauveria bassiana]